MKNLVNLASDTQTRPSQAMREYMAHAEVGDEQKGDDPTVNKLLEAACNLLGKEAALFLPTGTMCNLISIKVHTNPGDMVFTDSKSHIIRFEAGGAGAFCGVMIEQLPSHRGQFSGSDLACAIPYESRGSSPPKLLILEQTHNSGGGTIWPMESLQEVTKVAYDNKLVVHMDGARLFNATVETGVSAWEYANLVDSIWIDFTKGLGAPMGAVLAGSSEFISKAKFYKKMLGGAMRQAGIMAAGCLYALNNNIDRLKDDHALAKYMATKMQEIDGIEVDNDVETNMVFFSLSNPCLHLEGFLKELLINNIKMEAADHQRIRAVTHLDISQNDIDYVLDVIANIMKSTKA